VPAIWEHCHDVDAADLVEHVDRRLHFALARFGARIARVTVFLDDVNGPRGGVDKVCRIVVRLRSGADVVATVEDVDWVAAVDRATTRIGHSVGREVARTRTARGGHWDIRGAHVGGTGGRR
jgi:hypothetical protein